MNIRDRIGIDVGRKLSVEDAVAWAVDNEVRYIDCQIDVAPNALESFDEARAEPIRAACAEAGVHLGLHTLSAVNIAEYAPFVSDAVDRYLEHYVDACVRLKAEWIVVHAGYHFSSDVKERMEAGLERLKRIADYAEKKGARLLLENLNWEPDRAEVHYLAHTVEESLYYFDRIDSPALGWSFTVNHASLVPEGIAGFLEALPTARLGEVRLADNNGEYEVHMYPGTGIIDFADMFRRVEATGFTGHYMAAFGSLEEMLRGREELVGMFPKDA
ncbi:MAG TPA: sugar phosphate isomerase/epimerase family protein [Kiloniellales bacterium]|nr:sugar phosphate isomerase/epimerase family protein [Kiloniellales bacterium]